METPVIERTFYRSGIEGGGQMGTEAESKTALCAQFIPKAALKAMTPEAESAVPQGMLVQGIVGIRGFPFQVGRESRGKVVDGVFHRVERPRRGSAAPTNDLYLVDAGDMLQISREHFRIERTATGYQVVDRGSVCGISVGGVRIGGNESGGNVLLRDGDEIHVGTDMTPYRYAFIVLE
jgi:pSer/pThr/pTyr-binding forkhead associated (FHA) protein